VSYQRQRVGRRIKKGEVYRLGAGEIRGHLRKNKDCEQTLEPKSYGAGGNQYWMHRKGGRPIQVRFELRSAMGKVRELIERKKRMVHCC